MNKQKLSGIIMVPVVAIALFLAYRSYNATLAAPPRPVDTRAGGGAGGPGGAGGAPGGQQRPTPAQMLDTLAKELKLSDDQKAQVKGIQDDLAAKRKALPATRSRDDKRKQNTANREAADVKIK